MALMDTMLRNNRLKKKLDLLCGYNVVDCVNLKVLCYAPHPLQQGSISSKGKVSAIKALVGSHQTQH